MNLSGGSPKERCHSLRFEPLTRAIGAEVQGIDLNAPIDPATAEGLYQGLLDHLVLVFRDQNLEPEAHVALAETIGPVEPFHPFYPSVTGFPPIAIIEDNESSRPENAVWHSDLSPMRMPPFGSVLQGVVIPPIGGDTLWCSMLAAYEALDQEIADDIDGLVAIHDMGLGYEPNLDNGKSSTRAQVLTSWSKTQGNQSQHPLVMRHPATGRRLLYANASYTTHISGLNERKSRETLETLYRLLDRPEHQVRIHWQPGTVVLWDNLATQHYAVSDHFPQRRVMHRVTIAGNRRAPYNPMPKPAPEPFAGDAAPLS